MNLLRSITAVFLSLALLVGTTFVESEKSYANQDPNGEIQEVNEGYIQGWAHDPDLGNIPVEVKIYIDGKFYTNTMADIPFHSLTSSGLTPTSEHGFIVRFNNYNFTPGSTYQITAYALDNSTRAEVELSGSPVPLTITGGGNNTTTPNAQINVRGMNHYTNDLIPLDATSSTTTDHQTFNPDPPANLTFSWTLTTIPNNSTSTLSSTTDHTISFTPDLIGDYTIELIVTDPANNETDQTSTTITATSSSVTTVPNPINFVGTFDAELDTVYTSNANVISGFTGTVNATAGGGINTSIIKNGFDTGSTSVMIGAGDAIALKSTSSPLADTLQTITLTIGSSPTQWQLKTAQTPVNTPCIPDSQTWNTPGQHNFIHTPGCDHLMFEAWGAGANGEYQTYTVSDIKNYKYNLTVGDPQASPETLVAQDDLLTNNQITILEAKGGIDPKATTNPNGIIIATWSDTPPVPTGGSKPSKYKNLPEIIYHHSDHLGSSSIDTDETGAIVELIDYYPFGTPRLNENPGDYENDYKFTGKELDEDTDLYYYGARYYDAKIGRFVAIDPVALKNPTKVLSDPQQLNTYSYTRNNPLKYVDPEGEIVMFAPLALPALGSFVVGVATLAYVTFISPLVPSGPSILVNNPPPVDSLGRLVNDPPPADTISTLTFPAIQPDVASSIFTFPALQSGISDNFLHTPVYSGEKTNVMMSEQNRLPVGGTPNATDLLWKGGGVSQGRTNDVNGNPKIDYDFSDHGTPGKHSNPHIHRWTPNPDGSYDGGRSDPVNNVDINNLGNAGL